MELINKVLKEKKEMEIQDFLANWNILIYFICFVSKVLCIKNKRSNEKSPLV